MKKLLPWACAVLMTSTAVTLFYSFGLSPWTLILGVLLLSCPIGVIVVALREHRRVKRDIQNAEQALHRKNTA